MIPMLRITLSSIILVVLIESKTLPKYMIKCSLKDPDEFSRCAIDAGTTSLHQFLHGDKDFKITDLQPLKISSLELKNAGLTLKLSEAMVVGIETTKLKSIRFDKNNKKFNLDIHLDNLRIDSHYNIDGNILVLPIKGDGHGVLEFRDGDYNFTFDLTPVKKNGKEVIKVQNPQLNTHFGGAMFELKHLFDGNEQLGNEMNKFLNENWSEVIKEFNELIVTPMSQIVYGLFKSFLDDMPYNEVFSDV